MSTGEGTARDARGRRLGAIRLAWFVVGHIRRCSLRIADRYWRIVRRSVVQGVVSRLTVSASIRRRRLVKEGSKKWPATIEENKIRKEKQQVQCRGAEQPRGVMSEANRENDVTNSRGAGVVGDGCM